MSEYRACVNCEWARQYFEHDGTRGSIDGNKLMQCYFHAPKVSSGFPLVKETDFCSTFSPKGE